MKKKNLNYFVSAYKELLKNGDIQVAYAELVKYVQKKNKKLKLGLVFNHNDVRFEVWLLGQTKDVQKKYWKLLKSTKWINVSEMPQYSI